MQAKHDRGKPCHYYTLRHCVACYVTSYIVVTGLAPVMFAMLLFIILFILQVL
jgi:hypothetical protein